MTDNKFFTVAAFQGPIKQGGLQYNLDKTLQQLELAESKGVDVLCMPESFLHGYFESKSDALKFSLDLESSEYAKLLEHFKGYKNTTLLLGINERKSNAIYNTVIVIENGSHRGQYRKAYTYPPYDYYSLGREFPVFEKNGIKYGIIICIDSAYREPAHILALKGAQILFCPMFNRVANNARMLLYLNRKSHFITRAFDNECWFVSSDIVWEQDDKNVCAGYSTIVDKNGEVICKAEPFAEMQLQYAIPINNLRDENWQNKWDRRFLGNSELNKIMQETYKNRIDTKRVFNAKVLHH